MAETIVDEISEDRHGNVILLLRQTEPWANREALEQFQQRINGYIDIVTHGALHEKYPDLQTKPVRIRLLCYYAPPEEMQQKLNRVRQTLEQLKIGFEIVQINVENDRRDKLKERVVSLINKLRGK